MQLRRLNADLAISPQISAADVETLAALGFRSIINNRPENEAPDQPLWAELRAAATANRMEAVHLPVVASQISDEEVAKFREALSWLPKPIAAFCRTGLRSVVLWALANPSDLTVEERIDVAAAEGYDLLPFWTRLTAADERADYA